MRTCSGKEHEAHLVNRLFPGGHRLRASVGGVDHAMSEPKQVRERKPERIAISALRRIQDIDFDKQDDGRNDLYSGPKCFVKSWLIANRALQRIRRAQREA
jgi:hypothetical protein